MSFLRRIVPKKSSRRESPIFIIVILVIIAIVFLARTGFGQTIEDREHAKEVFAEANALYESDDFAGARVLYDRLIASGHGTREVHFNAGNAAFRLGDTGRAVLYYKRALQLDPHYTPARTNLDAIQPQTNVTSDEAFSEALIEEFARTSPLVWLLAVEATFVLLLLAGFFVMRTRPGTEQRSDWWGRFAGAAVALVIAGGLFVGHAHASLVRGDAVVLEDGVDARLGPGLQHRVQMELPAGTVLRLTGEPREGWVGFRLLDGTSGYISTAVIDPI